MSEQENEVLGKMTPEQYFQWRFTMEQYLHKQTQIALKEKMFVILQKDHELMRLKLENYRNVVRGAMVQKDVAFKEFERVRDEISKNIGVELKDKVINEYTYEVTDPKGNEDNSKE